MNKNEIVAILESHLVRANTYGESVSISASEATAMLKILKDTPKSEMFLKLPSKKYYSTSYGEVEVYTAFEIEEMLRKNQILFNS